MLKLASNLNILFVEMQITTQKESVEHVIRPAKVTSASYIKATCTQLLPTIHRLCNVLKRVEDW
jgi:hypothetical protein